MVGWEVLSNFIQFGDWVIKTHWGLEILDGNYETRKQDDNFSQLGSFITFPFNQQIQDR